MTKNISFFFLKTARKLERKLYIVTYAREIIPLFWVWAQKALVCVHSFQIKQFLCGVSKKEREIKAKMGG
jgi:hypothetical protein